MTDAAALQYRVEQLEEALGVDRGLCGQLRDTFGLEKVPAQILGHLYKREFVSREGLYTILYGNRHDDRLPRPKTMDTQICKLRAALRKNGHFIGIDTKWGEGWMMRREEKAKVAAQLGIKTNVVRLK